MKLRILKIREALRKFFKQHTAAAVTVCTAVVLCCCIVVGMFYILKNRFVLTGTPYTETVYTSADVKVPDVKIADENSAEDFVPSNDEGDNSGETDGFTIEKAFENIKSDRWESIAYGIDVSSHNGVVDWAEVAKSGVDFAMIRCGYRGYVTGSIVQDARFIENIWGAYDNGISVGVYFYSTAVNANEAREEAAWVCGMLDSLSQQGLRIVYPVAYDFEEFYNKDSATRAKNLSKKQLTANTVAFLEYVKRGNYTPMLYASKTAVMRYWNFNDVKDYGFWLAHYVESTDYTGDYDMWQYSSTGKVNGINGNVDLNISYYRYVYPSVAVAVKTDRQPVKNTPNKNAPDAASLSKTSTYERTRTLPDGWSEIRYSGFVGYVPTDCLTEVTFEDCSFRVTAAVNTHGYFKAVQTDEFIGCDIEAGTVLDITGRFGSIWYRATVNGQKMYVKADNFRDN